MIAAYVRGQKSPPNSVAGREGTGHSAFGTKKGKKVGRHYTLKRIQSLLHTKIGGGDQFNFSSLFTFNHINTSQIKGKR